ncbi:MAG: ABC transporter substrate-binding protein [Rhabdochlamydiaceae bacterium]
MIGSVEYLSLAPFPLNSDGSLDWNDSLSNWITSNSNFRQWTFHIRPGAAWSNGTAVTASDIVTWLSPGYALNPQYDFVGLHAEVTGVHAVNSDTAVIDLNISDAQLPNRVGTYYYAPLVSPTDVAQGPNATLFGTGIADGPWYISNYVSGTTTMTMLPNPYWPGVKPTACAIDVIFVENSAQMVPFLVSGQADLAGSLVFGNIAALEGHPNIKLLTLNGATGNFIQYNITEYPYNITQFRQALAYSINSSAIVQQSLFGFGVPANNAQGEVPSSFPFYTASQPQYPYNLSKALSLIHQLGFAGGGSQSSPLRFPNGTAMSVTIFTDTSKAWDPDVTQQVAGFLQNLGINAQTQTLTQQNLGADYATNAFNIQNNLVVYTSFGTLYFSPWVDAQQGCSVFGTPGCAGWTAISSADGQTHWEYPPSADAVYQSNLTAIDDTPPTNITGQEHYLSNIESLNAQYLPVIMLSYPDKIYAYNTEHWTDWPSYYFMQGGQLNETLFNALQPATTTSTSSTTKITSTSPSTGVTSASSNTGITHTTTSTGVTSIGNTTTSHPTTTSTNTGSIELIAGIVIIIIIIVGIVAYMMRRRPTR